jgi:hypothetical protein
MQVTINGEISLWPNEWPAPQTGMIINFHSVEMEICGVTWVLPEAFNLSPGQPALASPAVIVNAQKTFHQDALEKLNEAAN